MLLERFSELLFTQPSADNQSGYRTFAPDQYQELYKIALQLVRQNQTHFVFDFQQQPNFQDFTFFKGTEQTHFYCYKRQGGGDLFSYVRLEWKATGRPAVEITEQLPEELDNGLGICPKSQCTEWAAVLPYILKALIDHCLKKQQIGISFGIQEVRFHPVDYRPYAYYTCTRLLLEKMQCS